ncbi:MAG TPA: DUF4242 domain-containing protein [Bauldia sp.]|nr:DUF4242 domain-containing protein [Bauldia sp.]
MHRYVVERVIPGIGGSSTAQFCGIAQQSNSALAKLAPKVQWVESYVAGDRTFCIYLATDVDMVRKHAEISGFPADRIIEVPTIIDPTTAVAA